MSDSNNNAVDLVVLITVSLNPRNYWKLLKHRLLKEGNQSVTNCNQLKLKCLIEPGYHFVGINKMIKLNKIVSFNNYAN